MLATVAITACIVFDTGNREAGPGCGPDGTAADGHPCTCQEMCVSGTCFTESVTGVPHGECYQECTTEDDCSKGDHCSFGACMPSCFSADDCPVGRICDADDNGNLSCSALCQFDDDCISGNCSRYSGTCLPQGERPKGLGVGESCIDADECRSGFCIDGACLTRCSLVHQVCPDDTTCVASGDGEGGLCLPACDDDGDCRDYGLLSCVDFPEGGHCFYWEG